jgi:DNA mismatch repair protein MutL
MASVREALGRFNIVPSIDFENEALIDIPVRNPDDRIPSPPGIEINPDFNPFNGDVQSEMGKPGFIERFERENARNWDKLYSSFEKEPDGPDAVEKISEKGRKFFQLRNKFIACPVKSGLMLIDQRRAHERVLYERFLDSLGANRPVSQSELFPVPIELNAADYLVLSEIEEGVRLLGFDIELGAKNKVTIKGRPSEFLSKDPAEMLEIIIEDFKSTDTDPLRSSKEKLSTAMAAAAAISYGRTLDQSEMENLFDLLFACSAPNYSPKGKPVIMILTIEELEKKFK